MTHFPYLPYLILLPHEGCLVLSSTILLPHEGCLVLSSTNRYPLSLASSSGLWAFLTIMIRSNATSNHIMPSSKKLDAFMPELHIQITASVLSLLLHLSGTQLSSLNSRLQYLLALPCLLQTIGCLSHLQI